MEKVKAEAAAQIEAAEVRWRKPIRWKAPPAILTTLSSTERFYYDTLPIEAFRNANSFLNLSHFLAGAGRGRARARRGARGGGRAVGGHGDSAGARNCSSFSRVGNKRPSYSAAVCFLLVLRIRLHTVLLQ